MKSRIMAAAAGAATVTTAVTALSIPHTVEGNGYLSVPVNTVRSDLDGLTKRDAFEVLINNRQFYYSMDLMIGTPGQKVTVLLDTGSSELWVNPDCSKAPSASQARQCNSYGQYTSRNSRTPPSGPFGGRKLNYGDPSQPATQTSAEISYYSDNVALGSGVVLNQTFGVVTRSDGISTGILGLAPDLKSGFAPGKPYSLILNSLADQGKINSRVFSLDLRHSGAENGAIIFGGVDTGKYIGRLEQRPIINGAKGEPRLAVDLGGVSLHIANSQPKAYTLGPEDKNVMLDSGTTLTRLHESIARPILNDLNAKTDSNGYWITDCSLRTPPLTNGGADSYINFQFGRKTIRVPLSDFILDLGPRSGQCYVGIVITTDQQILGDSVLRAGYFVFDWDNQAVHIAQAATCGKEQIVTAGKGAGAIPATALGLCEGPSGDSDSSDEDQVSPPSPSAIEPATTALNLAPSEPPSSFTPPVSIATPASASATEFTKTLTPSQTSSPGFPGSSSSDTHSAAFSWMTQSRHLNLLLGGLMTLTAAFWAI
ncbi:secreted aspartic proteinase [Colletotrichum truncatum]|uniref:Secreted aspartic proteinase n=1 Tax=Colletotrichum truncatum TaxID=5467 RepID=A0ACC3Z0G3_COLTU|nr:secreted aspartic proteinase [Colletotrichum truncatum]KAF6800645.1 secreted aspartic proteinase [Colletotrichum truncatum]